MSERVQEDLGMSNKRTALVALGVAGASALFTGAVVSGEGTPPEESHNVHLVEDAVFEAPYEPVTDEDLSDGGYNCGHAIETAEEDNFDYARQMNFLANNPETAKNIIEFQVHDDTWGVGENAWDFLMQNGLDNPSTTKVGPLEIEGLEGEDADRLDQYVGKANLLALEAPRNYHNFTCSDGEGNPTDVHFVGNITIQEGNEGDRNHVVGVVLPTDKVAEFRKLANKVNGEVTVDIIHIGVEEVSNVKGGAEKMDISLVVTEAFGCDNPIRVSQPPKETPTTGKETTTSTPGSSIPPKHDDGHVPGPIDEGGESDIPGKGPSNQQPGDDGYLPGETRPSVPSTTSTTRQTTTTESSPATTGTQPTAPPVSVTTSTSVPNDTTPTTEAP